MRSVETGKRGPLTSEQIAGAVADAYARRVLSACVREARAVKDVSAETGLPLATTYRHVKRLVDQGLLVIERSALTPDGKRFDLYRSRLKRARLEFDERGERVTWDANERVEARLQDLWDTLRGQVDRP